MTAATRRGAVLAVFIWAPDEEGEWAPGAASRWWLHQSLAHLDAALRRIGSRLLIRRGPSGAALEELTRDSGADAVFWNRRYEPAVLERDRRIEERLRGAGLQVEIFNSALLFEPRTVRNRSGKPFQVFTAFWKHCLAMEPPPAPVPAPRRIALPAQTPVSLELAALKLEPRIDWVSGLRAEWQPGEAGAARRLRAICPRAFTQYASERECPALPSTSRLSPHLHFGEISPRQIWHAVRRCAEQHSVGLWRHSRFVTELGWREFAHHLLFHFPHTPERPLRASFERFPWRTNETQLDAWQRGRTGYPIVDAGMRELWRTGWMHNRVRMIVASFLTKDLLLPWQAGARWFWDTLVDADLANNTLGWQWTAGCGADAAPFFRIFNPVAQGEKFDPNGDYVRRWVPELAGLSVKWIHQPWRAPADALARAGVEPGRNYPEPIVDHGPARDAALRAFARTKSAR